MSAHPLPAQLLEDLAQLPPELQRRVQDFARALVITQPKGVPARSLLKYAGMLGPESARQMRDAIEDAFEQVDPDGW